MSVLTEAQADREWIIASLPALRDMLYSEGGMAYDRIRVTTSDSTESAAPLNVHVLDLLTCAGAILPVCLAELSDHALRSAGLLLRRLRDAMMDVVGPFPDSTRLDAPCDCGRDNWLHARGAVWLECGGGHVVMGRDVRRVMREMAERSNWWAGQIIDGTRTQDAGAWLRAILADGEMPVALVRQGAHLDGLSWRTVQRAAEGITAIRRDGRDAYWSLA